MRFCTTGIGGSTSVTVTFQNLLDSWLIAGTATNSYQLFDLVKVKRVTIRAMPSRAADIESVTVGIEFPGLVAGSIGAGNQTSNSSVGQAFPAFATLRPAKLSQSAQWQPSSTQVAFVLRATNADNTVPVGVIIDVHLAFKNCADISPAAISSAIAGATPGNLYFGGLDGGRLAATWARSVFVPRI